LRGKKRRDLSFLSRKKGGGNPARKTKNSCGGGGKGSAQKKNSHDGVVTHSTAFRSSGKNQVMRAKKKIWHDLSGSRVPYELRQKRGKVLKRSIERRPEARPRASEERKRETQKKKKKKKKKKKWWWSIGPDRKGKGGRRKLQSPRGENKTRTTRKENLRVWEKALFVVKRTPRRPTPFNHGEGELFQGEGLSSRRDS